MSMTRRVIKINNCTNIENSSSTNMMLVTDRPKIKCHHHLQIVTFMIFSSTWFCHQHRCYKSKNENKTLKNYFWNQLDTFFRVAFWKRENHKKWTWLILEYKIQISHLGSSFRRDKSHFHAVMGFILRHLTLTVIQNRLSWVITKRVELKVVSLLE